MKMTALLHVVLCSIVELDQRFIKVITLVKVLSTSETSVYFY
jgi:hypothetical protein